MRISLKSFRVENGLQDKDEFLKFLETASWDAIAPALCDEGCEVEPDGECPHGCPSILLVCGVI